MSVILQFDFSFPAEYLGDALTANAQELAHSINQEPGFIAKIWTENLETGEAGGLYKFADEASARRYLEMHIPRAESMGAKNVRYKIFTVNEPLTEITHGKQFL